MEADEIHPQAKAAADRRDRIPIPHSRRGLKLLRLVGDVAIRVRNRNPPAVGRTVDGTFPGPAGDLPVRLYLPDGGGPFPTVVFFHGGGYVFGSIDTHDLLCRRLTRQSDSAVLSVAYRLAPEHPFPAAVEDAYAAVEWAAANPDRIASDGRVAVAGDSAGGALAAIASLMAAERGGPEIAHQALFYPAVGVDEGQPSMRNHAGTVLDRADIEWFRECYFGSGVHERNPYADPTNACDLSGVAPATVVTAGFDPLRDGGRAYADRLAADGADVRYVNYEDMIHGFMTLQGVDRAHEAAASAAADLAAGLDRA